MQSMNLEILPKDAHQSIRQWAYELLRDNIIRLYLKPGTTVSEAEIAEILHTSRTPVREAFIRLSEDSLLEIFPQRGSFVSLIDIEQAEEACFTRNVLEKAILKEACKAFPEASLSELSANLELQKICRKENDYEKLYQLDNDFHRIIYRSCEKERVWLNIRKMNYNFDRLRILRLFTGSAAWDSIIEQHGQIIRLVRDSDCIQVDRIVDAHLARALVGEFKPEHFGFFKQDVRSHQALRRGRGERYYTV
jgi:DNA-binding GntR family transcriptional regulator